MSRVIKKMNTAFRILKHQGMRALLHSVSAYLRRDPTHPRPEEAAIAFDVLNRTRTWGRMVDVGAHFGGSLRYFAQANWEVFAFEPDSANRDKLRSSFGSFPRVSIDPRGVADKPSYGVPLYRSEESTGISGLSAFHPTHYFGEAIDVTTLELFAQENAIESVDFLKIDTEGFDLFVLQGVPWDRFRPELILCEFEDRKTIPLGYDFHSLADYLVSQGYRLIVSEWYPIRKYGTSHDWRRFVEYPCRLEDRNGWGNIFATNNETTYQLLRKACSLPS